MSSNKSLLRPDKEKWKITSQILSNYPWKEINQINNKCKKA